MRKPVSIELRSGYACWVEEEDGWGVDICSDDPFMVDDIERLAEWLLKAAAWIREQEGKR